MGAPVSSRAILGAQPQPEGSIISKILAALLGGFLAALVAITQAHAQGSTSWAQSILSAPVVNPPSPTTDTVGFVHNGKAAQAPVSAFGSAAGGGLSGMTPGQVPIAATANTVTSSQATATIGNSVLVQTDSTGHLLPPINSPSGVFGTLQVTGAGSGSCTFGTAFDSIGNLVKIGCPASGLSGPGSTTVGFAPLWGNTTGTNLTAGVSVNTIAAPNTIPETGSGNSIAAAFLPTPTASTLGGVESFTAPAHQWLNQISTAGVPIAAQPAFSDISGTLAAAQCPPGSSSALGCLEVGNGINVSGGIIQLGQVSSVTNQWIDSVSALGIAHLSQPAFSNLSGQATFAQFPSVTGPTILGRLSNTLGAPSAAYTPSNGADATVPLVHGATVATHCPQFSDTVGTLIDSGSSTCGGAGSLMVTDGTTTIMGTTQITFSSSLFKVGGSSPNATLGGVNLGSYTSGSFHLLGNPTNSSAPAVDTTLAAGTSMGITCASTTCTVNGTPVVFTGTTAGTANAQTIAAPVPSGFTTTDGYQINALIGSGLTNTAASPTLSVNGTAAYVMAAQTDAGLLPLSPGGIVAGYQAIFVYHTPCAAPISANCYVLQNPINGSTSTGDASPAVSAAQWNSGHIFNNPTGTVTLPVATSLSPMGNIVINTATGSVNLATNAADGVNGQPINRTFLLPAGGTYVVTTTGASGTGAFNVPLGPTQVTLTVANASSTGTTLNSLAKLTGAPSTAITALTTDTSGIEGIVTAGAGTTGSALITREGQASCIFDGATTAGDYVQISATTGGDCHDTGSATPPSSGQLIGRVLTTNGAGGTYAVNLSGPYNQSGGGGGGSGTVSPCSVTGAVPVYGTATSTTVSCATIAAGQIASSPLSGASGAATFKSVATILPFNFGGLVLSNDVTTPNTVFDVSAGSAANDGSPPTMQMALTAAFTKTLGAWVSGTGNGCLDTGTVASATWYDILEIGLVSSGAVDILCTLSTVSGPNPTFPAAFAGGVKRYLGSIMTCDAVICSAASTNIATLAIHGSVLKFPGLQAGVTPDIHTTTLGTAAGQLFTLAHVPPGHNVIPICRATVGTTGAAVIIRSPDEADLPPATTVPFGATGSPGFDQLDQSLSAGIINPTCPGVITNTSQQIGLRSSAASTAFDLVLTGFSY